MIVSTLSLTATRYSTVAKVRATAVATATVTADSASAAAGAGWLCYFKTILFTATERSRSTAGLLILQHWHRRSTAEVQQQAGSTRRFFLRPGRFSENNEDYLRTRSTILFKLREAVKHHDNWAEQQQQAVQYQVVVTSSRTAATSSASRRYICCYICCCIWCCCCCFCWCCRIHPFFRAAVPFWGQTMMEIHSKQD